jgi:hypothetical protein
VEEELELRIFSECVNDVPLISVEFGSHDGAPGTVTLTDSQGNVVGGGNITVDTSQLLTLLFPGAAIDENGNPTDWPGWAFVDGVWVEDSSDAHFRDGITVTVTVNPTEMVTVVYPPATPACDANPPAPQVVCDPNATDDDGDGYVQDDTPYQRPVGQPCVGALPQTK